MIPTPSGVDKVHSLPISIFDGFEEPFPPADDRPTPPYTAERIAALGEGEGSFVRAERVPLVEDDESNEACNSFDEDVAEPDFPTPTEPVPRPTREQIVEGRDRLIREGAARRRAEAAAAAAAEAARKEAERKEVERREAEREAVAEERRRANPLLARIEDARCPEGVRDWEFASLRSTLRGGLVPDQRGTANDPVLQAIQTGEDRASEGLLHSAVEAYLQNRVAYDALLGDEVPPRVRSAAARILKWRAYEEGTNPTADEDFDVYLERFEQRKADPLAALSTGFRSLDAALGGGLRGLVFLGGAAGVGKTSLSLQIATSVLEANPTLAVLIVGVDTVPKDHVYGMLRSAAAGVPLLRWQPGGLDETTQQRLREADVRLRERVLRRLRVVDRSSLPREGFTAEWLWEQRRDLVAKTGAEQVLQIIDHHQNLPPIRYQPDQEDGEYRQQITQDPDQYRLDVYRQIQGATRTVAHPAGDPMLVISKVRKDAGATNLETPDLMGDAALGYDAGTVMFLEPVPHSPIPGTEVPELVRVTKARGGVTGAQIRLLFDYPTYRFREVEVATRGDAGAKASKPKQGAGLDPLAGKKWRK